MKRILIIGRYPPPAGGNTIHIQRLATSLSAEGLNVVVLDMYANSLTCDSGSAPNGTSVIRRSPGIAGLIRCVRSLIDYSRGAVAHFHISAGGRFYALAPLLLFLTRRAEKRVLTIHAGDWLADFRRLPWLTKRIASKSIDAFDDIICVNEEQAFYLKGLVSSRLHIIPAYMPSSPSPDQAALPAEVVALREGVRVLVATSGYGTSTYDYETIVRALELVQKERTLEIGLVLATYSTWEQNYWSHIVERLAASPLRATVTRDLTPPQFLRLLSLTDLYIRASLTDGDAVAIREAAAMRTQVIASDCVSRPAGAAIFSTSDPTSLQRVVSDAIDDPAIGVLNDVGQSNFSAILSIYAAGLDSQ